MQNTYSASLQFSTQGFTKISLGHTVQKPPKASPLQPGLKAPCLPYLPPTHVQIRQATNLSHRR